MAKRPDIKRVTAGYGSNTMFNDNATEIEGAFDNTLSRDGSTPNEMEADLDLNSNDLLNVGTLTTDTIKVGGVTLVDATATPDWRGAWATSVAYAKDDLVRQDGNAYICLVAHTSGTFSTDLSMSKWELFAQKGAAGAGTGDMIASNNLSDVADVATSRSNLGLGPLATSSQISTDEVDAANKTGDDTDFVTGTAGGTDTLGKWNINGDMVEGPSFGTGANAVLQLDSDGKVPHAASRDEVGTTVLSGSNVTFTIPSWTCKIDVLIARASISSGTENFLVQLSTGGSYLTTGYDSISGGNTTTVTASNGMILRQTSAGSRWSGKMTLHKMTGNDEWVSTHILENQRGSGWVDLGGTIDELKFKIDGARTFDNGSVAVICYP